ncbi:MAG: mobile mystery protein A [Betaproteobacteria bacterium]|nr:mobile mystery protein A [Betaproteobacteria bacterium]
MQLAEMLRRYPRRDQTPPRSGWIRAVREALGMTQSQLAAQLGIARQTVDDLERAEAGRRITLESLDRLALAMGCRVVYAVVPEKGSLDDLRRRRALALADALQKRAEHSMKLEAQGVGKREADRQRKLLAEALLRGSPRKLWQ